MPTVYICRECGFKTESESDLDRHILRLHEGEIE